jgi:MFS family permease
MGPLLDRLGPRIISPSFALAGALGAFLFAFAKPFSIALSGRILIGVGMSCALMGAMKVFTLNFPPRKFATLVGIFISVGTLGSILAPLLCIPHIHHRMEDELHFCWCDNNSLGPLGLVGIKRGNEGGPSFS